MNKIFSSSKPKEEFPNEWSQYKERAVEFGKHLLTCYPYARWSNYVHKTIEHVQEVIESHGTLGGFSGFSLDTFAGIIQEKLELLKVILMC